MVSIEKILRFAKKHGYLYVNFVGSFRETDVYLPFGKKQKSDKVKYVIVEDGKIRLSKKKEAKSILRELEMG